MHQNTIVIMGHPPNTILLSSSLIASVDTQGEQPWLKVQTIITPRASRDTLKSTSEEGSRDL